jgi:hypothetical protein
MKARLYFSYGMTKTGSTLAFRLAQRFYQRNDCEQPLAPGHLLDEERLVNFIHMPAPEELSGLEQFAIDHDTCLVIKTHSPPTAEMVQMLREGRAFAHAVFRDPREIALSMIDHGKRNRETGGVAFAEIRDLKDAEAAIETQISYLEEWLRLPGVFPAYYDDFAWSHEPFIKKMRRQTGLKMRSVKGVLASFNNQKRVGFNKGQKDRWKDDMTAEESAAYLARFPKFYGKLIRWRWWPLQPFLRASQTLR